MFDDIRSKRVVFVAHCVLNQNSISDGTACYPAMFKEALQVFAQNDVGIAQMPCPELMCLGLDRGDKDGSRRPIVEENTRIRRAMGSGKATSMLDILSDQLVHQIEEYAKNGFSIIGMVGIDRSPSCGVNTTSICDKECAGRGVFIGMIQKKLQAKGIGIPFIGIRPDQPEKALALMKTLAQSQCPQAQGWGDQVPGQGESE